MEETLVSTKILNQNEQRTYGSIAFQLHPLAVATTTPSSCQLPGRPDLLLACAQSAEEVSSGHLSRVRNLTSRTALFI